MVHVYMTYRAMSDSLQLYGLQSIRLFCSWNFPGKNNWSAVPYSTPYPTQGSNPGLLHCRRILYQLSHQGSPRILECVGYRFSRGVFLTQESNQGLLHCRWILYQLSHRGSQ